MIYPSLSTLIAILVVFGILFALVRRLWTAGALLFYIMGFVVLLSVIKQAYLGGAISAADVVFFMLEPLENFYIFINYPMLGLALLCVCVGFGICLAIGLRFEKPLQSMLNKSHGQHIRILLAVASLILGFGAPFMSSEQARANAIENEMYDAFAIMNGMGYVSGVVDRLNFFFDNRVIKASLPAELLQTRFTVEDPAITNQDTGIRPDIFLVLEESTFNPTLIRDCAPIVCDQAMLHPLAAAQRTQQGPLLAHSTGGGTWLSEFALLTGFDWRVFGRGGAYAPVSLAPRMQNTLPAKLAALGYRTIAVYPTQGNFLNAKSAYGYYGFEEFYAAQDLDLPRDWQSTTDQVLFDKALTLINRSVDTRPVFILALTVRNHGPHGDGRLPVPPAFEEIRQQKGAPLADYLARMRTSSDDFIRLAEYWLQSPRPRIIGWFGDHQPEVSWQFTQHPELLNRDLIASNVSNQQIQYLTEYQLSANFGDNNESVSTAALDISYLGAQLMAFAGLPLDAGLRAARDVALSCQGLLLECSDHALINDYLSFRVYQLHEVR